MNKEIPNLVALLQTFAYHIDCIRTDRPMREEKPYSERVQFRLGLGYGPECPTVFVQVEITPSRNVAPEDPWGVWAQVSINGKWCGNRCGGGAEYARLCAPVIAWFAAHQEKQP